jgi:hypothetical protein
VHDNFRRRRSSETKNPAPASTDAGFYLGAER